MTPCYIHACGFVSALGRTDQSIHARLALEEPPDTLLDTHLLTNGSATTVGRVTGELPTLPPALKHHDCRNNRLAWAALQPVLSALERARAQYGAERIAVIVGSSTEGISDGEEALAYHAQNGNLPPGFTYHQQEAGNIGECVADLCDAKGPAYTISTACSSSARTYLSAQRLLAADLVDAVVVGGADTLCRLTVNGFLGLDSLTTTQCNPFSRNRNGIHIGEAAAFMLLTRDAPTDDAPAIAFLGGGESSDAHHISAPPPDGEGAAIAMADALQQAGLAPDELGYLNAHGTATPLNDVMEAKAIERILGCHIPVSSTKPLTGHTLGAAGAAEAAICWHILQHQLDLPIQVNDGEYDTALPPLAFVSTKSRLTKPFVMSNSLAFGGNNVSLIFGKLND